MGDIMKEIFISFSRYNERTNGIIFSYIEKMTFEQISYCIKAYYKNIIENTFHVMNSDIKWLNRLTKFRKTSVSRDELAFFEKDGKVDEYLVFENLRKYIDLRSKIDDEIIDIIDSIEEKEFKENIEIPFGTKTINLELWKILMQWFNHHTHHRGQISIQLDILGIEHDYSLVLDKIE
jgi:uncharacterized damage-inducible protein DinB